MGDSSTSSKFASVLKKHRPNLSSYEELYKHFHENPEISCQEYETAAEIERQLHRLAPNGELDIRTKIGGTGLIAICKNGSGPTILLRADMDGLPVTERTGLPYASKKTQKDDLDGKVKGTMHACGHDFHVTSLLAGVETLLSARESWSGTIVFLFQPAEERGRGAKDMVSDGLYDPNKHACPIPDVCLGQHVFPVRAGDVASKTGPVMSAADSYKITIYGKGGHGSMPHRCIDPVVIASHIVVRLQTIVSREIPPDETAVVTVGSLQAGDTVNVISDEATIQLNIRSVSQQWRKVLIDGVKRVVDAECEAGRCPKPAKIEQMNSFPLTDNDKDVTEKVSRSFDEYFGKHHVPEGAPVLGSEDFGVLATAVNKPYTFWFWGGIEHETWDKHAKEGTLNDIAVNHSPFFAPVLQPTLTTGVDAMVVAALTFVGK